MKRRHHVMIMITVAVACLGCDATNVGALIHSQIIYSLKHVSFLILLTSMSLMMFQFTQRLPSYHRLFFCLLVTHPALWRSAWSGDCGYGQADSSFNVSVIGVLLLTTQLLHLGTHKVRKWSVGIISFCVITPILYFALRPLPALSPSESGLLDAAANGNLMDVQRLVALGTPIDVRRTTEPPYRWKPFVDFWTGLRHPNYPFDLGFTPLMLAAIGGHGPVVEFLVSHGADVNAVESAGGSNAASFAHTYGHDDLIPVLLGKRVEAINSTRGR